MRAEQFRAFGHGCGGGRQARRTMSDGLAVGDVRGQSGAHELEKPTMVDANG
jgi:hypothetical protein